MLRWLVAGFVAFFSTLALAQGFPERPVRIIVPLTPGRFVDATEVARAAAEMKEVAKRRSGSGYAIDRRRESASVASPTP